MATTTTTTPMTSSKPHFIRALYDWIVENDLTPYLVVDVRHKDVQVPEDYIENNQIVLNVSPKACRGLILETDRIVFSTRFSGVPMQIFVPPASVLSIYAQENGRGMTFDGLEEDSGVGNAPPESRLPEKMQTKSKGKPKLSVVQSEK